MRLVSTIILLLLCQSSLSDESKPRMEFGLGLAGQHARDYRGSKASQFNSLPFFYVVYRGPFLQADRRGIKGKFFSNDKLELNISGEASLNGGSDDNPLRKGMPLLESAFELGPSLNINLTGKDFSNGWALRLPARSVFTVGESGVNYIGYNLNPKLTYWKTDVWKGWDVSVNIGGLYASRKYHDYYYSVDSEYANDSRPAYQAEAGFSGYYFKMSGRNHTGRVWYGWNVRYDNLSGVAFEDSPLVETDHYAAVSFAVGWQLWKSKRRQVRK